MCSVKAMAERLDAVGSADRHPGRPVGFTLIELMIVIVIIAIVAGVAIPNLLRSRMSANESMALASCRAYAEAQDIYHRTDWDADGVLEYATAIQGNASLFEKSSGSGDLALVDLALAQAEGDPGAVPAKSGYVFRILTGQGANAPGGARDYLAAAGLLYGYGICALPASYDNGGRNTFQENNSGVIYQRDQGAASSGVHLSRYNPDTSWVVSE